MTQLDAEGTTEPERQSDADIDLLRVFESIGLVVGDVTQARGSTVYRLIATLPASYVDSDGVTKSKERWPFEVWCDLLYPKSRPEIRVDRGSDVPCNDSFKQGLLARVHLRDMFLFRGSRVRWRPSPELKGMIKKPMDGVLAFLATINETELRRVLLEQRNALLGRLSHETLRFLLQERDGIENKPDANLPLSTGSDQRQINSSERHTGSTDVSPSPPLSPRDQLPAETSPEKERKKFVIRDIELDNVAAMEKPKSFRLLTVAKASAERDCSLFFYESALVQITDHIEWGRRSARNVYEQGGLIIGTRHKIPNSAEEFVLVTTALPAEAETRSSTYVKFDHISWNKLLMQFDQMKHDQRVTQGSVIIGWYHTHPNNLDVFMSGTDLGTQRSMFYRPWNYALVLNPQRQLVGCFVGKDARPANVGVLT